MICSYWIGELHNINDDLLTVIVLKTSMSIKKTYLDTLNLGENKLQIKKVKKNNESLTNTYILFKDNNNKFHFHDNDLKQSCIFKTISHIYMNKTNGSSIVRQFKEKCTI